MKFPNNNLNFDTALRYYPVVKLVEKGNYKDILEVGSGVNGISDFYKGKVIGLDSDFSKTSTKKNPNIIHKKGSATKIPFKASTFPIVICLDTLEHIPEKMREKVIKELLRVVKKGGLLILGFPCGSLSWHFEKVINYLFMKTHKFENPWLKEHKSFGLPDEKVVIKILKKEKAVFRIIPNVNIFIWFFTHLIFTVFDSGRLARHLKLLGPLLFRLMNINLPPYYRLIFVITK